MQFSIKSPYQPTGDQPACIDQLSDGYKQNKQHQVLLGVTGSGKTFSIANVIQKIQKPTLVIAHNKTLAAQLYQEFRDFFPENAVSYFVSYYDYYQPESYIPSTDTYIEKETQINDEIDKLRLASTTNLLTRPDCIVVASVSCIYNLGSPVEYGKYILQLVEGELISRQSILTQLVNLQYQRNDVDLARGTFRVRGETIQVWPAYEDNALTISMLGNQIEKIVRIDPLTGNSIEGTFLERDRMSGNSGARRYILYPAKHYMTNPLTQEESVAQIEADLNKRLAELRGNGKIVEAYRLEQKVHYDLDMIKELGFVNGIENYSRYFDGRKPGQAPFTLIDYFHENAKNFGDGSFLTVIDESHISIPQIRGMYNGDQSRKGTLIDYGFRLPSALDNRPLKFDEFRNRVKNIIYTSATPGKYEIENSKNIAEQIIRPTGLIDPTIEIKPIQENRTNGYEGQIKDFIKEAQIVIDRGDRVLATTLTKKMAEDLSEYLKDKGFKVSYLHSDIKTIERITILTDFRKGKYDCLIGVNLLREGLDLPEVSLIAIFDADKEGFLRSETSLIQTIGRAARNINGKILLYADNMTGSIERALKETERRRNLQIEYNKKHNITPKTIKKEIKDITENIKSKHEKTLHEITKIDEEEANKDFDKFIKAKRLQLEEAVKDLDFETAAVLRDEIAYFMNQKLSVKTKKH
jgi:excinuclease ABC subunit B